MKKLILLALLASCVPKKDDYAPLKSDEPSGISYVYDARVEKCFYYASEWRLNSTGGSIAGSMTLQETACTDKLKAVAKTVGAVEVPARAATAPE